MKQRRVVTTPEADEDAKQIDQQWIQNITIALSGERNGQLRLTLHHR
jgi:hypothetical protein